MDVSRVYELGAMNDKGKPRHGNWLLEPARCEHVHWPTIGGKRIHEPREAIQSRCRQAGQSGTGSRTEQGNPQ
jgi:hypothetical protein